MKIDIASTVRVGQRITALASILGIESGKIPDEVTVGDEAFRKPFIVHHTNGKLVAARYVSADGNTFFEVMGPA
jgi:hypothetical protein